VAGGYQLTVGLKKDGAVWTVGYGAAGQLGNGTTDTLTKPVLVKGLSTVKAIAAGYMNVMALKADGTVWGWGSNTYRQLGNPRLSADVSSTPIRAGTLTGVVAIAAAAGHSVRTPDSNRRIFSQSKGKFIKSRAVVR
jgi:alpha-tubulin suppressor-like RCC1 family protein